MEERGNHEVRAANICGLQLRMRSCLQERLKIIKVSPLAMLKPKGKNLEVVGPLREDREMLLDDKRDGGTAQHQLYLCLYLKGKQCSTW